MLSDLVQNSGTIECLQMIAFDRDTFVVVGWKGVILTSANGTRWTRRKSGITDRLDAIVYRDGRFESFVTNRMALISTDGVKWVAP